MAEQADAKAQEAFAKLTDLEKKFAEISAEQEAAERRLVWQFEKRRMAELYEPRREIIKGIPRFWSTALTNHTDLSSLLEADDMAALQHLDSINIHATGEDGLESLEIDFVFGSNPFFEDAKLSKRFTFDPARTITSASHMKIKWKPGKNLTTSSGSSDDKKRKVEEMDTASFFMWFEDPHVDTSSEVAALIYDELWPHAFDYYRNITADGDDGEQLYDDDDDDDADNDGADGPVAYDADEVYDAQDD